MTQRKILRVAWVAGALAGAALGVMAYRDMQERQALEQQLEDWRHREWINDLVEQRREEFKQIGRHKL